MDERREFPRHEVQIAGMIFSADMLCCVDVVIKELSEGGALVSSAAPAAFPKQGYLWQAKTGTLFECEVRWRKGSRLFGLRFTDQCSRERLRALIEDCAGRQGQKQGKSLRVVQARAA
jgi:hypothetical protein